MNAAERKLVREALKLAMTYAENYARDMVCEQREWNEKGAVATMQDLRKLMKKTRKARRVLQ